MTCSPACKDRAKANGLTKRGPRKRGGVDPALQQEPPPAIPDELPLDSELVTEDAQQSLESSSIIQETEEQLPPSEEVYEPAPEVQEAQEVRPLTSESAPDSNPTHGNGSLPASRLHIELPKMLEAYVEKLVQQEVQRILPAAVNEQLRSRIKTLFAQL
jgi:hypothetical protein